MILIERISQSVEKVLEEYDIHLTTERFNHLYDYLEDLITEIEENGQ